MSITETAPTPVAPVPKCPDCRGRGRHPGGDDGDGWAVPDVPCTACEGTGQDLHQLRLMVIATFAHLIHPGVRVESTLGMLRDAQAEIDRLNLLLPGVRAAAMDEAGEVLRHRSMWMAAVLLEEHLAAGNPPPRGTHRCPREAWVHLLRAQTLHVGTPAMARVAQVGLAIATYTDREGKGAFPGRATLATLGCCSEVQVRRAVQVLLAAGMLHRHEPRPNRARAYDLLLPTGPVDWQQHLAVYRSKPAPERV